MLDNLEKRLELIGKLEKKRESRILVYFLHDSARLADDAMIHLHDKLHDLGHQPRLDVFIYGHGGFTEVTWKTISLLRDFTDHLGILIPYRAHSGVTLISLAANEIVMGPMSELSPTDPSIGHPLLPKGDAPKPVPISVQDLRRCVDFIKREQETPTDFVTPLFQYIHPLVIGAVEQAHELTRNIARNALLTHWNEDEHGDKINHIVKMLNGEFNAHRYPINRYEARDELGLPVIFAPAALWDDIWDLYWLYHQDIHREHPIPGQVGMMHRYVCAIETAQRTTTLRQTLARQEGKERILEMRWDTQARE